MHVDYTSTYSVPISCETCTSEISTALSTLESVTSITYNIPSKLVHITGSAPPSSIIPKIQSTGRTAILRGSGRSNTAAVCILEVPWQQGLEEKVEGKTVRGLMRLIELKEGVTLCDLSVTGMPPRGRYIASVRVSGDVSGGRTKMGSLFHGSEGKREARIGEIAVDEGGRGAFVGEIGWNVWEMVGRGFLVEKEGGGGKGKDEAVMGVIARSAGVWENDKVVCSCTGKTLWEEREEMVGKGIL